MQVIAYQLLLLFMGLISVYFKGNWEVWFAASLVCAAMSKKD